MCILSHLVFVLVVSGWAWIRVAAQLDGIVFPPCNTSSGMQWAFNMDDQSPCQVAAILEGSCFGNRWNLSALTPGREYGGPNSLANSNPCQCNTVAYSLVSACGACQNGRFPPWSQWRENCSNTDVTIAGFPHEIPPTTGVPAWAYIDVTLPTNGNMWNKDAAQANASSNPPETSGGALPPKSVSKTSISASVTDATGIPSPTTVETSSKPKAGPIAGGVVGGVLGLAALAFVAFFLYRKSYLPQEYVLHVNEKMDIGGAASPAPTRGALHARTPSGGEQLQLYDPYDPTTFPSSPFPTFTSESHNSQDSSYHSIGRAASRSVSGASGYSGIPEI